MEHSSTTAGTGSTGRGVMDRVRESATAQLSTQKTRATDGLGSVAQAVRQSARPFRDNQQDTIAEYVEKAADQLERFSTRLRERDLNELMNDAERFARRQPALFIGVAFTAGLLGARFLKSSSENRRRGGLQRYEPAPYTPAGYRGSATGAGPGATGGYASTSGSDRSGRFTGGTGNTGGR